MTPAMPKSRKIVSTTRIVLFGSFMLALAACQTDGTSPTAADAPKAEVASPKPDTAAPKTQAAKPAEPAADAEPMTRARAARERSEEHTSELQSRVDLVCRLLLEKKKQQKAEAI